MGVLYVPRSVQSNHKTMKYLCKISHVIMLLRHPEIIKQLLAGGGYMVSSFRSKQQTKYRITTEQGMI